MEKALRFFRKIINILLLSTWSDVVFGILVNDEGKQRLMNVDLFDDSQVFDRLDLMLLGDHRRLYTVVVCVCVYLNEK
jgi:hypothetical protein